MRLFCPHCGARLIISSSSQITNSLRRSYVQCSDVQRCGASGVMSHNYEHDLNPPHKTTLEMAAELIKKLPKDQREALLAVGEFG